MEELKWYVTLGDGTFVEMDSRPYVFLATQEQIDKMDRDNGGNAPIDCTDEADGAFDSHIHIYDLVHLSHWADHSAVYDEECGAETNALMNPPRQHE